MVDLISFLSILSSLLVMLGIVFHYYHPIPEDRDRLRPAHTDNQNTSLFILRSPALSVLSLLNISTITILEETPTPETMREHTMRRKGMECFFSRVGLGGILRLYETMQCMSLHEKD
jgi:hypothetical protein